ncbi:MAG: hypothetical protein AVDCRST_MAG17-252, partial [uncultured Solirubrobacterales bacterium]
ALAGTSAASIPGLRQRARRHLQADDGRSLRPLRGVHQEVERVPQDPQGVRLLGDRGQPSLLAAAGGLHRLHLRPARLQEPRALLRAPRRRGRLAAGSLRRDHRRRAPRRRRDVGAGRAQGRLGRPRLGHGRLRPQRRIAVQLHHGLAEPVGGLQHGSRARDRRLRARLRAGLRRHASGSQGLRRRVLPQPRLGPRQPPARAGRAGLARREPAGAPGV